MLILTFLLWSISNIYDEDISIIPPQGNVREITNADIKPKDLRAGYYTEQWTFHFKLNNDIQIVYTISLNDLGRFKERVGGAKVLAYWLDGKEYSINKEYPYPDFYYDALTNEVGLNRKRPYWFKGSLDTCLVVHFKTGKNGIDYDIHLKMNNILKGKIAGDGIYTINDTKLLGFKNLIAYADVSGSVAINGDTLDVSGFGYADHQFQNFNSSKFISSGFRFHSGDARSGVTSNIIFSDKYHIPFGYVLEIKDNQVNYNPITGYSSKNIIRIKGAKIESEYELSYGKSKRMNIIINEKLLDYSIFDELSRFMKGIAQRIFGAEIIEFIADGDYKKSKDTILNGFIMK